MKGWLEPLEEEKAFCLHKAFAPVNKIPHLSQPKSGCDAIINATSFLSKMCAREHCSRLPGLMVFLD